MVLACLETLFSISDLVGRLMRANAICDLRHSGSNRVSRLMRSTCYALRETELQRELSNDMIAIRGYLNAIDSCAARRSCSYRVGRSSRVMFNWKIGRPNFDKSAGDTDHRPSFQRKVAASMTFLKNDLCPRRSSPSFRTRRSTRRFICTASCLNSWVKFRRFADDLTTGFLGIARSPSCPAF